MTFVPGASLSHSWRTLDSSGGASRCPRYLTLRIAVFNWMLWFCLQGYAYVNDSPVVVLVMVVLMSALEVRAPTVICGTLALVRLTPVEPDDPRLISFLAIAPLAALTAPKNWKRRKRAPEMATVPCVQLCQVSAVPGAASLHSCTHPRPSADDCRLQVGQGVVAAYLYF